MANTDLLTYEYAPPPCCTSPCCTPPPPLPGPLPSRRLDFTFFLGPPPPIVPGFRGGGAKTICCVLFPFHKLRSHRSSPLPPPFRSFSFLTAKKGPIIVMSCIPLKLRSHLPSRLDIISSVFWAYFGIIPFLCHQKGRRPTLTCWPVTMHQSPVLYPAPCPISPKRALCVDGQQ